VTEACGEALVEGETLELGEGRALEVGAGEALEEGEVLAQEVAVGVREGEAEAAGEDVPLPE
jgi:hypothetical protein